MDNNFETILNEYYKLKSKYEYENDKNKKSIINNKELSKREKQQEFQRLKPKCINCKRVGGTIFTNTIRTGDGEKNIRTLKSICGVHENPCNLKIILDISPYYLISDVVKEKEDDIKEYKKNIINYKNYVLFGYFSEHTIVNNFNSLKEDISSDMDLYSYYLENYNNIIDNKENNDKIEQNKTDIQIYITNIKDAIHEFNKTNNEQFIIDALNIYINKLQPLTKETTHLKYKENLVRYDEYEKVYKLIQNKYSIKDIEFNTTDNKVIDNKI